MAKEYFSQVSSSFQAVQCTLSSILCPSVFRQICRHCKPSPLLCPINANSSSSYVFRLQIPCIIHCRIAKSKKLKTLVAFERKKPPMTDLGPDSKTHVWKYTRDLHETRRSLLVRGGEIFSRTVCSPHQQPKKICYIYCILAVHDNNKLQNFVVFSGFL